MTAAKIATAIVLVSFVGHCHAQENSLLQPLNNSPVVVATQTNARSNYALLQPIHNKAKSKSSLAQRQLGEMSQPIAGKSLFASDVVVVPHSFKRGVFDRHQFIVRNDGNKILKGGKVLLTAPAGSTIHQVIPKPDSVSGLDVEIAIGELAPGAREIVEVAIKYPRDELARFETKIVAQNWTAPPKVNSEVVSNTSRMLTPRATGLLKPTVPVVTVSATTSRVTAEQPVNVSKMLVPSPSGEVRLLKLERSPRAPAIAKAARVQEAVPPPAPVQEPVDWKASIEASLRGPISAVVGEEIEFSIEVDNRSSEVTKGVIIQLSVPEQMKVTVLDRAAWYDSETRKLSWEIAELGPGETESVRYKAIVKTDCSIEQVVVTGAGGRFQCKSTIQTSAN